jgi:hypothetical protein
MDLVKMYFIENHLQNQNEGTHILHTEGLLNY